VFAPLEDSVHCWPEANIPLPAEEKETLPVGDETLDVVSVTVAVQLVCVETVTDVGVHVTAVAVVSVAVWPMTMVAWPLLAASSAFAGKDAVRCWAPEALGV
jgi:hypothetical protein